MQPLEEKLASFYLGQQFDLAQGSALDQAVHYDARDLTTHAVVLGMTGSGKTGLGVILLEEAALDGVPSLVIDPKGDMTNLLLTFPDLLPEDFASWVNPDDARRKNQDIAAYAAATAESWRKGLEATGQSADRIRRLRDLAEFSIYTPGSSAGRPVNIMQSFKAPDLSWDTESETLRDKIGSIVSALLALVGIEADPVRSREHILLSNIFENAWRAGQDLDLEQLIRRIQDPPFSQLGVFPVDTFFPAKDRMQLALLLNGLIASPSFADWIRGDPLDVDALLHSPSGKTRVSIVYIAHLSDTERQFCVTLLLEQVVSWMRAQSGTTSLRALLYMDEMFGYLPPVGNPPTKRPFLTLLKQARAFGLGLVLATQNPVDLDYKALTNAGTWFIGRMQADRDKQRLLDGLEGVQTGAGGPSRSDLDRMISAIRPRVFILHNVHEQKPLLFTTRWALSYLRGPLTLPQVRQLAALQAPPPPVAAPQSAAEGTPGPGTAPGPRPIPAAPQPEPRPAGVPLSNVPPQLPSAVKQVYLPVRVPLQTAVAGWARERHPSLRAQPAPQGALVYEPGVVGLANLFFAHAPSHRTFVREAAYLVRVAEGDVDWSRGQVPIEANDLEGKAEPDASFAPLAPGFGTEKSLAALQKQFADHLFYNSTLTLRHNPNLKLYSQPDETEDAFRRRCRQAAETAHAAELKGLKVKYGARLSRLEDKKGREERELEQDKAEYGARKQEAFLTGAESVLSLFSSRKKSRRLSSVSAKHRMSRQAKADVQESEDAIKAFESQIDELEAQARQELDDVTAKWQKRMDEVQEIDVRPKRADVQVILFAVAWIPRWELTVAGQGLSLPAFETQPTS